MSSPETEPATGAGPGGVPFALRAWPAMPRFARFLVVGGVNTAFGYATFAVLLQVGLHYAVAAALSTGLGVLFNFQTIGRLVFGSRDPTLIFRFVGVYVATYLLNVGALRLLQGGALDVLHAQALLVLPLAGVSFVLHRGLVFGEKVGTP